MKDLWIQTKAGRAFDFVDMSRNTWNPKEVATILARVPRFNGHSRWFYSVAQHSCEMVYRAVTRELMFTALLHDAPEAYIGDIASPVKWYVARDGNASLHNLEFGIWEWVCKQVGLNPTRIEAIKGLDMKALATERRDLMVDCEREWIELPEPWYGKIRPWDIHYARDEWLRMYDQLCG